MCFCVCVSTYFLGDDRFYASGILVGECDLVQGRSIYVCYQEVPGLHSLALKVKDQVKFKLALVGPKHFHYFPFDFVGNYQC